MKKWFFLILIVLANKIYASNPPLFRFYIKNTTGERALLHYKLADDISATYSPEIKGIYSNINIMLENNEIIDIKITLSGQYDRRYRGEMYFEKGYININDFLSIFKEFSFTLIESNKILYGKDMKQEYIKYIMNPPKKNLTHFFVLEIP
jgi:hypothetical protein